MRLPLAALLLATLPACKPAERGGTEAVAAPTPATVARADFAHIAYLQGRWRGVDASGKAFFESYIALDDTTMRSFTFSDSTFAAPSESGRIRWASGQVRIDGGELRWVATLWSADSVRFEPELGASNSFTWIRRSPDAWLARLEARGAPAPVVYEMSRLAE